MYTVSAKLNRRSQILKEATRLFSKRGYDNVSMKEVASVCGITEPAVYRHFESKEAVYDAVLDALQARLDEDTFFDRVAQESNIDTLLETLAKHILDFYCTNEDSCRLLLYSALTHHKKARSVFKAIRGTYVTFLIKQLDRLYAEKKIVRKNNTITARCFVGMIFECAMSMTVWRGFQGRTFEPADVVANNVPIYARGLKA